MADKKISALTNATTPLAGSEVLPIVQSGSTVKVSVANLTAGRDVAALSVTGGSIKISGNTVESTGTNQNINFSPNGTGQIVYARPTLMTDGVPNNAALLTSLNGTTTVDVQAFNYGVGYNTKLRLNPDGGNVEVTKDNLIIGTAGKGIDFSANANAPGMTSEVLDWYETGTWTPTISGSSSNPTITYAAGDTGGFYTRIGNVVYVTFEVRWSAVSGGSGDVRIEGLPYARKDSTQPGGDRFAVESRGVTYTGDSLIAQVQRTLNYMTLFSNDQAGGAGNILQCSGLGIVTVGYIRGSGFYYV